MSFVKHGGKKITFDRGQIYFSIGLTWHALIDINKWNIGTGASNEHRPAGHKIQSSVLKVPISFILPRSTKQPTANYIMSMRIPNNWGKEKHVLMRTWRRTFCHTQGYMKDLTSFNLWAHIFLISQKANFLDILISSQNWQRSKEYSQRPLVIGTKGTNPDTLFINKSRCKTRQISNTLSWAMNFP